MFQAKRNRNIAKQMYRHRCDPKKHIKQKPQPSSQFDKKIFCTKSEYAGQWDDTGMSGYGVTYDGRLRDSMFHGEGVLVYPSGARMEGSWGKGHMTAHRFIFDDGLYYGPYCEMPDRRFYIEIKDHIYPADRSLYSNYCTTRKIPDGCYDTCDGFYNPQTKCVYDPKELKKVIRIPTLEEHKWIIKNCRKAWDEGVGYRPELYENWQREQETNTKIDIMTSKQLLQQSIDYLCYRKNYKRYSYIP